MPRMRPPKQLQSLAVQILFGLCCLTIQGSLQSAELHVTQNQLPVLLGQYLDYFEDTGRELTIDDIMRMEVP